MATYNANDPLATLISLSLLATVTETAHADFLLGVELVTNGDAETGDTTGWASNGFETLTRASAGTAGLPPGVDIGNFSFWAGTGPETAQTLVQTIDISSGAALIDSGVITYDFSVLLQSRSVPAFTDLVKATLSFVDTRSVSLASLTFHDRSVVDNVDDWDLMTSLQSLPVGTRSIVIALESTRSGGTSSDGLIDNVSLRLGAVPEPASLGLMGLGILGLLGFGWRRHRAANLA